MQNSPISVADVYCTYLASKLSSRFQEVRYGIRVQNDIGA